MNFLLILLACMVLGVAFVATCLFAITLWKKNKIVNGVAIQSSSGDSEVMTVNFNFLEDEHAESKASKIFEAFQMIQDRRDENHEKWLKIKAEAQKENEQKVENGEELKLRSVSQE